MVRTFLAVGAGLAVFLFVGLLRDRADVQAISGCCKDRPTYRDGWRPNDMSFADCQQSNQERDQSDPIFEPAGFVWWDRLCEPAG